jgi:hypothetical protein
MALLPPGSLLSAICIIFRLSHVPVNTHNLTNLFSVRIRLPVKVIFYQRLSINTPTKRGKEKSSSDGHCERQKEMDDHLLACQQILEREPRLAKELASLLKINDIKYISVFGTPDWHHCCIV